MEVLINTSHVSALSSSSEESHARTGQVSAGAWRILIRTDGIFKIRGEPSVFFFWCFQVVNQTGSDPSNCLLNGVATRSIKTVAFLLLFLYY